LAARLGREPAAVAAQLRHLGDDGAAVEAYCRQRARAVAVEPAEA
jgi:hypothetical protein